MRRLEHLNQKRLIYNARIKAFRKPILKSSTIISDDCWGSEFYRIHKIPYLSPFIGLYVEPSSYLSLIENIREVISTPLVFVTETNKPFPVALAGDIKLNFMHYSSSHEAHLAWQRRCNRINWNELFFKIDFSPREPFGSHGYLSNDVERWNKIADHRFIALVNQVELCEKIKNSIFVKDWEPNAIKTYYHSQMKFSTESWINTVQKEKTDF